MINLHLWSDDDLNILHLTVGDPPMMQHLGGIESSEKILQRHQRYLKRVTPDKGEMFTIWLEPDSKILGTIDSGRKLGKRN